MNSTTLIAAFIAGLAGSVHCLGMCGGIAGALGMAGGADRGRIMGAFNALAYNLGRVGTYGLIGAIAGGLLAASGDALGVPGWAGALRIATAVILIAIGLQLAVNWRGLQRLEALGGRFWQKLAPVARRFMPPRTPFHALALGALWGWLPCGLVYTMVVAAAVAGDALNGAGVMIAFGLGTLPAMTGTALLGRHVNSLRQRPGFRRIAGAVLIAFGVWTAFLPLSHILPGDPPMAENGHQH
jgi:sulfite exporter TauE/SafE